MESLIKSSEPLVALAGAFFLIGLCFDLIFSREFKDKIRKTISDNWALGNFSRNALVTSAQYLSHEVMSVDRGTAFFLKTLALSVSFYVIVAVIDTRLHDDGDFSLQGNLARNLLQLSPAVMVVAMFHVLFDFLSAYITVLYLRLIVLCRSLRYVLLILLSDILVTATFWSIFFGGVIAIHLKFADFEQRETSVVLTFPTTESYPGWVENSPMRTNKSLQKAKTVTPELTIATAGNSIPPAANARLLLLTNEPDNKTIAATLFRIAVFTNPKSLIAISGLTEQGESYSTKFSASRLINFADLPKIATSYYNILFPSDVALGEFAYLATQKMYSGYLEGYSDHLGWPRDDRNVVMCNDNIQILSEVEFGQFDFQQCTRYVATHSSTGKYIGLAAGIGFSNNYFIPYKAFFWSSLALTVTYYLVFLSFVIGATVTRILAAQIAKKVLNLEQAFFTPLFSILSVALLILFVLQTIGRQLA